MAFSSSRDRPASTSQIRIKIKTEAEKTTNVIEQSSRSQTHPAGGQTTSPPTKQGYLARTQHARFWNDELLQTPSGEQSLVQHSSAASTRTRTHPRERPPSTNSKTEER